MSNDYRSFIRFAASEKTAAKEATGYTFKKSLVGAAFYGEVLSHPSENESQKILEVSAYDKRGALVGVSEFGYFNDARGGILSCLSVHVADKHRRKGIATKMYNIAEEYYGDSVKPYPGHSNDAAKFWKDRRKTINASSEDIKDSKSASEAWQDIQDILKSQEEISKRVSQFPHSEEQLLKIIKQGDPLDEPFMQDGTTPRKFLNHYRCSIEETKDGIELWNIDGSYGIVIDGKYLDFHLNNIDTIRLYEELRKLKRSGNRTVRQASSTNMHCLVCGGNSRESGYHGNSKKYTCNKCGYKFSNK